MTSLGSRSNSLQCASPDLTAGTCVSRNPPRLLYLCDHSTTVLLTDRAELGCPVYKAKGEPITVPDSATWADVGWAVALKQAGTVDALTADAGWAVPGMD